MSSRRKAREAAFQILYQMEFSEESPRAIFDASEVARELEDAEARDFALSLVEGARKQLAEIDALLRRLCENWRLERMATVDRTILRLGAYELLHRRDVPPRAVINEAVELGKRFGAEESGAFINGILDRIFKEVLPSQP